MKSSTSLKYRITVHCMVACYYGSFSAVSICISNMWHLTAMMRDTERSVPATWQFHRSLSMHVTPLQLAKVLPPAAFTAAASLNGSSLFVVVPLQVCVPEWCRWQVCLLHHQHAHPATRRWRHHRQEDGLNPLLDPPAGSYTGQSGCQRSASQNACCRQTGHIVIVTHL